MSEIRSFEFDLEPDDEWPPVSSECLPLRASPDGHVVLTSPLFVTGISVGDALSVTVEEGTSRVAAWGHVSRSGNSTMWLARLASERGALSRLSQRLRAVGRNVTEAPALGMCTVDVPSAVQIASVDEILEEVSPDEVAVAFRRCVTTRHTHRIEGPERHATRPRGLASDLAGGRAGVLRGPLRSVRHRRGLGCPSVEEERRDHSHECRVVWRSGRSDLVMAIRVSEKDDGFRFDVDSVHVP